jgi:hypothetical protein
MNATTQNTDTTTTTPAAATTPSQYDFSKPVNQDGSLKKYVQYVMAIKDAGKELTKREILTIVNGKEPKGDVRGTANKPFKLLKDKEILRYNRATKSWQLSDNSGEFIALIESEKEKVTTAAVAA